MTLSDAEIAQRAADLLSGVERLVESGMLAPTEAEPVLRAARLVGDIAGRPSVYAFTGKLKTGKSELINCLIDYRDLLPNLSTVSTGNVVYVRLVPGPRAPAPDQLVCEVEYLTADELADCRRFMIDELWTAFGNAKYLRDIPFPDRNAPWHEIAAWSGKVDKANDAGLWHRLAELASVYRAELTCPALIGGRRREPLGAVKQALVQMRDTAIGGRGEPFANAAKTPATGNELADGFPLVRRISLTVPVPEEIWPSGLPGAAVHLIDFPGGGAIQSGMRDRWLMRREFPSVTTLIAVVDASRPDEQGPLDVVNMFVEQAEDREERRDAVLAVVNRFDLLPDGVPAGPVTIDSLGEKPVGRATDAACLLIADGSEHERIAFTSPWIHHLRTGAPLPDPDQAQVVRTKADGWAAIAAHLAADEPRKTFLTPALEAIGADGGIRRLRGLIHDHAKGPGGRQRTRLLAKADKELDAWFSELLGGLSDGGQVIAAEPHPERQRLRALLNACAKSAEKHANSPRLLGGTKATTDLPDEISARAAALVAAWPEWGLLFQSVGPDGRIILTGSAPDKTDVFQERFRTAISEICDWAVQESQARVKAWAARQTTEAEAITRELAPLVNESKNELRRGELVETIRDVIRCLQHSWLLQLPSPIPGRPDPDLHFPLAPHRVLPWHPRALPHVNPEYSDRMRHQVRIMHLRRELTRAVALVGAAQLNEALAGWQALISTKYKEVSLRLTGNGWQEQLLDILHGPVVPHDKADIVAALKALRPSPPGFVEFGIFGENL